MKRTIITAALVAAALSPVAANAAVINWDYSLDAWFDDPAFTSGSGTPSAGRYDLSWGSDGSRSALAIRDENGTFGGTGGPAMGSLQTNGGLELANRFYHNNQVVPNGSRMLDDVMLRFNLSLTPVGASGDPVRVNISPFLVNFRETPNQGPCESGIGSCADIFAFSSNAPLANGVFTSSFLFDNQRYFLDLTAQGLGRLTNQQCTAAGEDTGCVGFVTQENELNLTRLALRIRGDDPVPEPATIGLLGVGLMGVAAARRRRR